jgi:glycosyltransferase involved in cell wall biosynthesis
MLQEALASIVGADEVILVDDGSDFDPMPLLNTMPYPAAMIRAPSWSLDQRLTTPRLGGLINLALGYCRQEIVIYLCDDDLLAPGWIPAVKSWFAEHPFDHLLAGEWRCFQDGDDPLATSRLWKGDDRNLTTGSFAHRLGCFRDEGVRWNETVVAVHDDFFLRNLDRIHDTYQVPRTQALAGYRREHRHNMAHYTEWPARYLPTARAVLAGGWLE